MSLIKTNLGKNFMKKVSLLCQKINKVEWSGILFYETIGDIATPEKMVVILKDILLMDIGGAVTTETDYDETFFDFLDANPEAIDWQKGSIHSHHSMGVFFSGTDMADLNKSVKEHNVYLSVIVNNAQEIIGKVAYEAKGTATATMKYQAYDYLGKPYFIEKEVSMKDDIFVELDCDFGDLANKIVVEDTFFLARLENVLDKKTKIPQGGYNLGRSWHTSQRIENSQERMDPLAYNLVMGMPHPQGNVDYISDILSINRELFTQDSTKEEIAEAIRFYAQEAVEYFYEDLIGNKVNKKPILQSLEKIWQRLENQHSKTLVRAIINRFTYYNGTAS